MHELESEASRQRTIAAEETERSRRIADERHHVTMEQLERRVAQKLADKAMVRIRKHFDKVVLRQASCEFQAQIYTNRSADPCLFGPVSLIFS